MNCARLPTSDGGFVIVCSRGRSRTRRPCVVCSAPSTRLCDTRVGKGTCDAPLCDRCTNSPREGADYCPRHAPRKPEEQMTLDAQLELTKHQEAAARPARALELESRADHPASPDRCPACEGVDPHQCPTCRGGIVRIGGSFRAPPSAEWTRGACSASEAECWGCPGWGIDCRAAWTRARTFAELAELYRLVERLPRGRSRGREDWTVRLRTTERPPTAALLVLAAGGVAPFGGRVEGGRRGDDWSSYEVTVHTS